MTGLKPANHGVDHLEDWSDPIPGLGQVPRWQATTALAFDTGSAANVSGAFSTDGDSYFWVEMNSIATFGATILGNIVYGVVTPATFGTGHIGIPIAGTDSSSGGPLGTGGVTGAGALTDASTGTVYPLLLQANPSANWLMEFLIAGAPGVFVTKTVPVTLAAGDTITAFWSTCSSG